MQKKAIALAVAGLISTGAFAAATSVDVGVGGTAALVGTAGSLTVTLDPSGQLLITQPTTVGSPVSGPGIPAVTLDSSYDPATQTTTIYTVTAAGTTTTTTTPTPGSGAVFDANGSLTLNQSSSSTTVLTVDNATKVVIDSNPSSPNFGNVISTTPVSGTYTANPADPAAGTFVEGAGSTATTTSSPTGGNLTVSGVITANGIANTGTITTGTINGTGTGGALTLHGGTTSTTVVLDNAGMHVSDSTNGLTFNVNQNGNTTTAGSATIANGLMVQSGGASITGGLNNNSGGITNAGAVSGVTTLNASGLATLSGGASISGGLNNNGGGITNAGAVSGVTTLDASGLATLSGGIATNGGNITTANGSINAGSGNITTTGTVSAGTGVVGAGGLSVAGDLTASTNAYLGGATPTLTVTSGAVTVENGAAVNMGMNRVQGVANGTSAHDAVNYGQLLDVRKEARRGIAGASALAGLPALESGKQYNFGIGFGNYKGESALALGGHARINPDTVAKFGVGFNGSDATVSAGVGWSF